MMTKLENILHGFDDADNVLAERIEDINCGWQKKTITDATARTYFGDNAVTSYYNPFLKKVILVLKGTSIKELAANSAIGIGNVLADQIPSGNVYAKSVYTQNDVWLVKNNVNQTIALSNKGTTAVAVGTEFSAQLEYTVLD